VILALEGAHLFGDHIGREWEDRMVAQVVARRRGQAPPASARPYTPPPAPSPSAGPTGYNPAPAAPSTPEAPPEGLGPSSLSAESPPPPSPVV
jgi:hypothetical protein